MLDKSDNAVRNFMGFEEYADLPPELKNKDIEEAGRIVEKRYPEVCGVKIQILPERRHVLALNDVLSRVTVLVEQMKVKAGV